MIFAMKGKLLNTVTRMETASEYLFPVRDRGIRIRLQVIQPVQIHDDLYRYLQVIGRRLLHKLESVHGYGKHKIVLQHAVIFKRQVQCPQGIRGNIACIGIRQQNRPRSKNLNRKVRQTPFCIRIFTIFASYDT